MEHGSLVDLPSSAGSLAPPIQLTAVSDSWGPDAAAGNRQQHSPDQGVDNFFSLTSDNASQPTPPAALLPPSDSPDERAAAAASSPRPCDPCAGFGSPAALAQDDQLPSDAKQASRQQELLQKQQQAQQQHLQQKYSHQHGLHEQLPFGHLQDVQHHGSHHQQQLVPSKPGHTPVSNHRQRHQHHEQLFSTPVHHKLQRQPALGTPNSLSPSLQPAIERVTTLGRILRQHGASQGEAHANARLLLATISAKQVKTRQMIASVTPPTTPSSHLQQQQLPLQQETDQQHQQLQLQLKQATDQLAAVRAELVASRSELAAARTAGGQQAELLQQRSQELQELRGSLLRHESSYQAEVDGLQERLLEAEGQLAKLSAVLPGGWRQSTDETGGTAATGTPASRSMSVPARPADVALPAGSGQTASDASNPAVAANGSPPKLALQLSPSLALLTPDQAAAAQYKGWLRESQAALMAAQEDLMDRERQIKQLEQQLQQLQHRHHRQGQQQEQGQQQDAGDSAIERQPQRQQEELQRSDSLEAHRQQTQQQLEDLQTALDDAHSAAQAARAVAEAVSSERDSLRVELSQLSQQAQSAVAARAEAVAAWEAAQHAAELYRNQIVQLTSQVSTLGTAGEATAARPGYGSAAASDDSSDAAAKAAQTAAAEAQLLEAREAAAAAMAEVAELQQQLKQMQEQQRERGKQPVAAQATPATDQQGQWQQWQLAHPSADGPADQGGQQLQLQEQPEGSVEYQLLRATSANQALQSELIDIKQRLLLLLQLVKKAATEAGRQQQQLPAELAELSDAASVAAMHLVAAADGSTGGDNGAVDVACLLQVVSGLQQRYCCSQEHQQLLLRGKEMQFLLENALQQVHLIKAAGSDFGCSCPSETEYQLMAGGLAAIAEQHRPATAAVAPLPAVTAAANIPLVDNAHDDLLTGTEHLTTATPAASTSLTCQLPGSCSNDALRGSAGYSGAAGSRLGFTVADEGLGYEGLDGSWWATSTLGNTTADDLPAFLLPKAE